MQLFWPLIQCYDLNKFNHSNFFIYQVPVIPIVISDYVPIFNKKNKTFKSGKLYNHLSIHLKRNVHHGIDIVHQGENVQSKNYAPTPCYLTAMGEKCVLLYSYIYLLCGNMLLKRLWLLAFFSGTGKNVFKIALPLRNRYYFSKVCKIFLWNRVFILEKGKVFLNPVASLPLNHFQYPAPWGHCLGSELHVTRTTLKNLC